MAEAVRPITIVRVLNTNTNKAIEEHVKVKDGKALVYGNEVIQGVPGVGSRIDMYFENTRGSVTRKLFPTGNKKDFFDIPDYGEIEVAFIYCATPVVFIRAEDLGIIGIELIQLNNNKKVMEHIERIRCIAAGKAGFVKHWEEVRTESTSVPKVSIISKSRRYFDLDKNEIKTESMDICARAISVGSIHKAYPMTVAIATGAALCISGTIVNDLAKVSEDNMIIRIGHTSDVTNVEVKYEYLLFF